MLYHDIMKIIRVQHYYCKSVDVIIVEALIVQVEQIQQMLAYLEKLAWYHWKIKVSDAVMLLFSEELNIPCLLPSEVFHGWQSC